MRKVGGVAGEALTMWAFMGVNSSYGAIGRCPFFFGTSEAQLWPKAWTLRQCQICDRGHCLLVVIVYTSVPLFIKPSAYSLLWQCWDWLRSRKTKPPQNKMYVPTPASLMLGEWGGEGAYLLTSVFSSEKWGCQRTIVSLKGDYWWEKK